MEIAEYLASKDLKVKQANATNVHLSCFFCGESEDARGRLYISTDPPNFWQCFLCGESGGLNKIRKHFGDAPIPFASAEHKEDALPDDVQLAIFADAAEHYHSNLGVTSFDYLRKTRGLENDTIQKFKLGWAENGNNLVGKLLSLGHALDDIKKTGLVDQFGNDTLGGMITIPYMVMGNVVTIRGKYMGAKYMSLPHATNRLFNVDTLLEGDRTKAVICEGEFDAMSLHQLGFTAVGVPGAALFQDAWVDYFGETKRVYIAMDNDKAGKLGAEKTASKIGQKARIVEMPEGFDVNDWMVKEGKKWEDFDFLFNCAPGGLLVTVDQAYDRWMEIEGNPDLVGLRFNVKSLDDEMRHGLTPGQVLTMIAKTNTGKTILTLNFFQRMALMDPNVKILFVSMEQSRNEWFERARRIHTFYDPWAEIPDTLNYWRPKLHLVDRNRLTEDELRGVVEQYAYEVGEVPDFVCVDYLGYYARSYKADSGYERTTAAIMSLKAIAREFNTVMYAPHQVNRTGAFGKELSADMAQESSAVEQTSDMMLAIWNPDQQLGVRPDDQQGLIHMKIVKSRDGAVGRELQFLFCPKTLALVPTDDAKHMTRAENERKCNGLAEQWEHMLYRHRTGDYSTHALDDLEVRKFLAESKKPAGWVDLALSSSGSTFSL